MHSPTPVAQPDRREALRDHESPTSLAVLDTNVALDLLAFREPGVAPLLRALEEGRLSWLAVPVMRTEFEHVLRRPRFASRGWDATAVLARYDALVHPEPAEAVPSARTRCRDDDDQVFLDLALARGARWLFSKDRDLLSLARRARADGLSIVSPSAWDANEA